MTVTGYIHQGAIVPDKPLGLAEGARVEFELTGTAARVPTTSQPATVDDWAIFRDVDSQQVEEIEAAILDRSDGREVDL